MKEQDTSAKILSSLSDLTRAVKVLRADVSTTKSDIKMIALRQLTAENDAKALQTDIQDLKTDVHRLEVLHEETQDTIERIAEIVAPALEQVAELRQVSSKQAETMGEHDRRIGFLEKKTA